jgi:hypothetical protein
MWRNHCSQLLIVHGVSDVRQAETHCRAFEVELAIEKLKKRDTNQQVLIKSQQNLLKQWIGQFTVRTVDIRIMFGIRKNCLRSGRSRSLYLFIRRATKQTVIITEAYHFRQLHTKFYPTSCCRGDLHMARKLFGTLSVDLDATGQ